MVPSATEGWSLINIPSFAHLPRPVYLRSLLLPKRHVFPLHSHNWHQFTYAASGSLMVTVEKSWYVIAQEQAIWVPRGVRHTTGAFQDAEFRNLYTVDAPDLNMPACSTVLSATPLLRALIAELADISHRVERDEYVAQIDRLILEQLHRQPKEDFHLPWPESPSLHKICQELYADPACTRSFAEWGKAVGASPRTLARRFEKELGMAPREWRTNLRLFKAIDLLESSDNITEIALKLGYSTPSAFTYMFHQKMGCTPSEWRRR
ncbi:MAG: helix-turn-helix transcriptional regulator [Solidesulfovibrio sp.]